MQISVYYSEEDQYLLDKVEEKAQRERRSKSSVILSILETYFEADKRIGQILKDLDVLSSRQLEEGLQHQRRDEVNEPLGQILLDKGYVQEVDLDDALAIQSNGDSRNV